jgi:hypothetical protein
MRTKNQKLFVRRLLINNALDNSKLAERFRAKEFDMPKPKKKGKLKKNPMPKPKKNGYGD